MVFERGLVWKQVEALEHHAGLQPLPPDLAFAEPMQPAALLPHAQELAVEPDAATVDRGELVDAAEQRGLARAGGADQTHHLAGPDVERDIFESLKLAKTLADGADRDEGFCHRASRNVPRAKRRSSSIWSGVRTETTSRYQSPATIRSSITRELA
ncbi:hypothetical protein ACVWWO_006472 [Bradyrhizobium sp. F1.13.1]